MTKLSPSGTPEKEGKRDIVEEVLASSPKRLKLDTDVASDKPEEEKAPTKKQLEKIERQKQRELEKLERDRKKEEERIKKEEDRRLREEERKKKLEEKELEKESRRKKLEEEKIERERKKEEERLKKLAEREEKEKIRLEKKLKLEEEKRKADEEKKKAEEAKKRAEEAKERSQMKISSFFTPRKRVLSEDSEPLASSIGNDSSDTPQTASTTSSSTTSTSATSTSTSPSRSNNKSSPSKNVHICTYDRVFLPFFQKKNVTMPKLGTLTKEDLALAKDRFDSILSIKCEEDQASYVNFMKNCRLKIQSETSNSSVATTKTEMLTEKIMAALNSNDATENEIYDMIERIPPVKYLQFYENSKPPYIGTWCSEEHLKIKFPANDPFFKIPAGVDYEYDSDFDWNEEEDGEEGEGEDIDNDEDDEEEEDGMEEEEEDFEDFVDSNGEGQKKRKRFVGPLISLSIWNDGNDNDFFETMKYEPVNEKIQFPINPTFGYWSRKKVEKEEDREESKAGDANTKEAAQSSEEKPLLPMLLLVGAAVAAASPTTLTDIIGSKTAPNVLVAQKPIIKDNKAIFELLKFVEENNDFTIGTLVELSHKKFKSFTKALIKHTIKDIATYNKKTGNWEVNQDIKEKFSQGVNT